MAGKITELSALTASTAAVSDLIETIDLSDTTMGVSGTNKKMTLAELAAFFGQYNLTGGGMANTHGTIVPANGYDPTLYYYVNYGPAVNAGGAMAAVNLVLNHPAGFTHYVPCYFSHDAVISEVGFTRSSVAAAERRQWFSLYADSGSGKPSTLIADWGEIVLPNATALGQKVLTGLSTPVKAATLYWFGFCPNSTNSGSEYWQTAGANIPTVPGCFTYGANTGYVTPPATVPGGAGPQNGWGGPLLVFKVSS